MGCKLRIGKLASYLTTAVHPIFPEVANRRGDVRLSESCRIPRNYPDGFAGRLQPARADEERHCPVRRLSLPACRRAGTPHPSRLRMASHCHCASQGFVFAFTRWGSRPPCARLTSGHAKGFMGVVENSPVWSRDPGTGKAAPATTSSHRRAESPPRTLKTRLRPKRRRGGAHWPNRPCGSRAGQRRRCGAAPLRPDASGATAGDVWRS
jgi:hypothetical protein